MGGQAVARIAELKGQNFFAKPLVCACLMGGQGSRALFEDTPCGRVVTKPSYIHRMLRLDRCMPARAWNNSVDSPILNLTRRLGRSVGEEQDSANREPGHDKRGQNQLEAQGTVRQPAKHAARLSRDTANSTSQICVHRKPR
jgi:hypothetical protein